MAQTPVRSGAYYDDKPTPQNLRTIWSQIIQMRSDLTAAQATITTQAATIAEQQAALDANVKATQQAAIAAGKATAAATTTNNTGPGGGGTPPANGAKYPNYASLVQQAKDDLTTEGEDLTGNCGAFKIVRRAVQYIAPSNPAVGLFHKSGGTGCSINGDFYSIDRICFNDGWLYDTLFDAGGVNTVQWNFDGVADPNDYRPGF